MNATNNYLFKYMTLYNSILFENQGVTPGNSARNACWCFLCSSASA
jgi:hypothetical protein